MFINFGTKTTSIRYYHPKIRINDYEKKLHLTYQIQNIKMLQKQLPKWQLICTSLELRSCVGRPEKFTSRNGRDERMRGVTSDAL